jgi:hypothetical protein
MMDAITALICILLCDPVRRLPFPPAAMGLDQC